MDVLLIAGLWLDASVWSTTADELARLGVRPVPVRLPGQGDGSSTATLADQVAAVVAAVDSAKPGCVVVGHSAAATLAWVAADARPERVARVVLVGGFPGMDGSTYADFFPPVDGVMPFPGWEPFAGADSADLDDDRRAALEGGAIPVPQAVSQGIVRLADERRYAVPITMVCPEFSPDEARAWVRAGELPELARAADVEYVDTDSGHWPMVTRPQDLARLIADAAAPRG
ncbi:alpha/beta fold hydrolase [Cumulibacter manganitolerans]|uniref:alpha/beta fold hydrolase n=1 Tax=Cumulibacter manganitolerans TaxID=1884992 RepID=UPI001297F8E9|nr:alpha/beta hydrolase [Cumulibacter manganitolerans]